MIVNGYPVLGGCDWVLEQKDEVFAVCAVGAAKTRRMIVERLQCARFATLVDPTVQMSQRVEMGEGCIVCAGSILTVNIKLGSHVIVNLDCTIGHDAILGDYVTLYPSVNVSGNTFLEECVEMGTGSQVIQSQSIKPNVVADNTAVINIDN
jgi:sugar O-acyltransferase (sialic acid O-acetyltransferase NeuD family)